MKKNLFLFALVIFSFLFGKAQIIVDHTSTNLLDVPTQWVDSAKHKLLYSIRIYLSRQSVGIWNVCTYCFCQWGRTWPIVASGFLQPHNGGSDNAWILTIMQ
jgi:hypothetical protein